MSTGSTPSTLFTPEHWQQIEQLLRTLDDRQALWLGNHLAADSKVASAPSPSAARIAVIHGGETGNGEGVAKKLSERLQLAGLPVKVEDMARLRVRQLSRYDYIAVICSTHGDGDPPEPTLAFFEALLADNAPRLEHLHFSVLALGDSSYEHFCVAGKQLDERFQALGATRLLERVDCDVDFEEPAQQWGQALLDTLAKQVTPAGTSANVVQVEQETTRTFSKQSPLSAEVLENICLSSAQRDAAVYHMEIAMEEEGFVVAPGDAVGVLPENPPALIAAILDATQLSAEDAVTVGDTAMTLVQALRQHVDLTVAGPRFLEYWAPLSGSTELQEIGAEAAAARAHLKTVQLRDIVTRYPANATAQHFVDRLRP
ncbi:MAG: flavodoxin domain-containing protein, partial [Pseudomonas sp.]